MPVDGYGPDELSYEDGNLLVRIGAGQPGIPVEAIGTTSDPPASSVVAEDVTARTGISLWKGIKNILLLFSAKFAAGTIIGNVRVDQTTPGTTNLVDITVGQVQPQMDDTDKVAVSLYGKDAAAGDKEVNVTPAGAVVSAPMAAESLSTEAAAVSPARFRDIDDGLRGGVIHPFLFNLTNYDVQRNNVEATLLASAARTAETDSADQVNYNNNSGLIVVVDITVDPSTASITPELQIKDSISGSYFTVWTAAAALAAVGTYAYLFSLGGVGSAGSYTEAVNLLVGRTWRFEMNVADAESMTYSVSSVLLS